MYFVKLKITTATLSLSLIHDNLATQLFLKWTGLHGMLGSVKSYASRVEGEPHVQQCTLFGGVFSIFRVCENHHVYLDRVSVAVGATVPPCRAT